MRCEICDRLILNNRYKKFIDAKTHYLHQTCFDVFSNGGERERIRPRIKLKRKNTKDTRPSTKAKLFKSYESINTYSYIKP